MIISHKHKFIFVKTAKVAGTSIELALREILGDDDIATPIVSYDEEFAKRNGYPPPQNYNYKYMDIIKSNNAKGVMHEHSWAYEIKGWFGEEIWNNYYTFTVERDPVQKSISNYFHYRRKENGGGWTSKLRPIISKMIGRDGYKYNASICANSTNLDQWVKLDSQRHFSQNYLRYTIDDHVIVNKVYNYSFLDEMIADLESRLSHDLRLPVTKKGNNKNILSNQVLDRYSDILYESSLFSKEKEILLANQ